GLTDAEGLLRVSRSPGFPDLREELGGIRILDGKALVIQNPMIARPGLNADRLRGFTIRFPPDADWVMTPSSGSIARSCRAATKGQTRLHDRGIAGPGRSHGHGDPGRARADGRFSGALRDECRA